MPAFHFPIANEHSEICKQLRFAARYTNQAHYPPVILNFDAHHDFYASEQLSASWARQMMHSHEAIVFTILPNLSEDNSGGLGSVLQTAPRALCGFGSHHDYRTLTESQRITYPSLNNLKIVFHKSNHLPDPVYQLTNYPGPIWISIDYDFFSLHPRYHLSSDCVNRQLHYLAHYLTAAQIVPDEIVGFRSKIYLFADGREKTWLKEVDKAVHAFRSYFFLPIGKKKSRSIGLNSIGLK
jgi:hypothetical protein